MVQCKRRQTKGRQPRLSWLPKLTDGTLSLKRGGLCSALCSVLCSVINGLSAKFYESCHSTVQLCLPGPGHTIPIGLIKKPQEL